MASPVSAEQSKRARYVLFGEARWDRAARRLTVRGLPAKLPWRVVECLSILVDAGGSVVTKEDLENQIWGGAMVEYSNVAQCITALRKALDPAPDGGSHIETVARVGYRLAVPLAHEEETAAPEPPPPPPRRRVTPKRLALAALAIVPLLAGAAFSYKHIVLRRQADALIERGLVLSRRNDANDTVRANALFQQANDLLPDYPLAQAAMAESAARRGNLTFDAAIDLARLAVKRDPDCGECQAIAGYVLMSRGWKWAEAEAHLKRATEIDPNAATRRIWYAEWLAVHNRLPEAMEHAQAALRLAPAEPRTHTMAALIHYLAGRYRESVRAAENAVSLDPRHNPSYYWMYRSYLQMGNDIGAIMARSRFLSSTHARYEEEFERVHGEYLSKHYERGGRTEMARAWIRQFDTGPSREIQRYARAVWFMWIGERENAIAELQAAVRSKPYHLIFVAVDPAFEPLRGDPRFQEVVRAVGLKPQS